MQLSPRAVGAPPFSSRSIGCISPLPTRSSQLAAIGVPSTRWYCADEWVSRAAADSAGVDSHALYVPSRFAAAARAAQIASAPASPPSAPVCVVLVTNTRFGVDESAA